MAIISKSVASLDLTCFIITLSYLWLAKCCIPTKLNVVILPSNWVKYCKQLSLWLGEKDKNYWNMRQTSVCMCTEFPFIRLTCHHWSTQSVRLWCPKVSCQCQLQLRWRPKWLCPLYLLQCPHKLRNNNMSTKVWFWKIQCCGWFKFRKKFQPY